MYAKIGLLSFGVNFAFVLTRPESAVKSSRQTRRIFSTITNSLMITKSKGASELKVHAYILIMILLLGVTHQLIIIRDMLCVKMIFCCCKSLECYLLDLHTYND